MALAAVARVGTRGWSGCHWSRPFDASQSVASVAPFLVEDWTISYAAVGALIGAYMLPGFLVALPSGMLARRFAYRTLVICGLAMMVGIFWDIGDQAAPRR